MHLTFSDIRNNLNGHKNFSKFMNDISVSVSPDLSNTHFFIYKDKQYPFNMVIFNLFSQYFNSNRQIQSNSGIKLIDDTDGDINIPDESINDFINYCQNKEINLTKINVPYIYKLAKKFIVPSLTKATEDFIASNKKEFVFEYLIMSKDHNEFETNKYEEMISDDLIDYAKDGKLLTLPIPILHRIITKYQLKFHDNSNSEIPSEIIEFLFRCLDNFGKQSSVLFSNFDFGQMNGKVVSRLFKDYSEIFDFHFINSDLLKSIYQKGNELIKRESEMMTEMAAIKAENEILRKQIESTKNIAEIQTQTINDYKQRLSNALHNDQSLGWAKLHVLNLINGVK